jgi:hypothetical protein
VKQYEVNGSRLDLKVPTEEGFSDIIALAEALKRRINAPDVSALNKQKYAAHLQYLREFVQERVDNSAHYRAFIYKKDGKFEQQWQDISNKLKPSSHELMAAIDAQSSIALQPENFPKIFDHKSFATLPQSHQLSAGYTFDIDHLTDEGKKNIIDFAVQLKKRIDAPTTSAEDKKKYEFYLKALRQMAKERVAFYRNGDQYNQSWKEIDKIVQSDSALGSLGLTAALPPAVTMPVAVSPANALQDALAKFNVESFVSLPVSAPYTPVGNWMPINTPKLMAQL